MGFYDRHVLPHVLDLVCGMPMVTAKRRRVVPLAEGRVLEVGIGSGLNLPHYDRARVQRVIGLDPGEALLATARRRSASSPVPVEFLALEGEHIPLDAGSIDTVVVTYTLCTIPGVEQALEGMRRVLRPGGRLLFCEHGLAPDAGVVRWQRRLDPLWGRMAGGCHLTRDTGALLARAGFAVDWIEQAYARGAPRFAGWHNIGIATPR
jgi:ubiquinone/menaquinone biosynthesis C-methylase UbiE